MIAFSTTRMALARLSRLLLISLILMPLSVQAEAQKPADGSKQHPLELNWDNLMPEGYDTEALLKKFEKDLAKLESLPDDSEEGFAIIQKIQAAVDQIPTNSKLDGKWVSLPGYIAPLKMHNEMIQQFLLVPYFGACIHVPPPPVNQTVLVDTLPGQAIRLNESHLSFMITGKLSLQKTDTDIGHAGYHISEAEVEVHLDPSWMEVEE